MFDEGQQEEYIVDDAVVSQCADGQRREVQFMSTKCHHSAEGKSKRILISFNFSKVGTKVFL